MSPAGLRTAGEVADGVLPFFMSPEKAAAIVDPIVEGRVRAGKSRDLADFDNAPYVRVSMGDDLAKCRDALRPGLALYIGGMGARSANFYNDLARRMGYEAEAAEIQDLFLAGKRQEAAAAVPDALIDEISLVGPPERIRDRLQAWQDDRRQELGRLAGADRRRCRGDARHRRGGAVGPASRCRADKRSAIRQRARATSADYAPLSPGHPPYVLAPHPIEILRGIASFAFFKFRVRTPSSSLALICCRSILFDSVNDRAKWPTLYSV